MAEIATFKCGNRRCNLVVRVCKDFPVWRPEAPKSGRSIPPSASLRPFVARFRSEIYCHHCPRIIADASGRSCDKCGNTDLREDQTSKPCTQCCTGTFDMVDLVIR